MRSGGYDEDLYPEPAWNLVFAITGNAMLDRKLRTPELALPPQRIQSFYYEQSTLKPSDVTLWEAQSYMPIGPTSIATRQTSSLKCLPAENRCTSSMTS
jgi:hypothetical protein